MTIAKLGFEPRVPTSGLSTRITKQMLQQGLDIAFRLGDSQNPVPLGDPHSVTLYAVIRESEMFNHYYDHECKATRGSRTHNLEVVTSTLPIEIG